MPMTYDELGKHFGWKSLKDQMNDLEVERELLDQFQSMGMDNVDEEDIYQNKKDLFEGMNMLEKYKKGEVQCNTIFEYVDRLCLLYYSLLNTECNYPENMLDDIEYLQDELEDYVNTEDRIEKMIVAYDVFKAMCKLLNKIEVYELENTIESISLK